ncbi:Box C/D snoRNA accumulation [Coemansia brasiliensis]|uniref:Box C/D snoRNA accumulation n=1 Tax=Coemansia brasiliensis TaxID=2650707 RepID=A0A9W8LYB6_9FUNG|nr:Box C/D snoRNA accumulation [Coemansia brasiliensis]
MMSDYEFLQDLARDHTLLLRDAQEAKLGSANRLANQNSMINQSSQSPTIALTRAQKNIISHAKKHRQVIIQYMSPGIKRHQQNKTIWMSSKSRLVWTLELVVPEITQLPNKWVEAGFHDVCRLSDLWYRILCSDKTWSEVTTNKDTEDVPRKRIRGEDIRIQLPSDDGNEYPFKSSIQPKLHQVLREDSSYRQPENLLWLIRVQNMPANRPTFCKIDSLQPLFTQLRYQTVLEFPTIYVYKEPPTTWGGYDVTIQEHCVASEDSSSEEEQSDTNDKDTNAEN